MKKIISISVILVILLSVFSPITTIAEGFDYNTAVPYEVTVSVYGDLTTKRGFAWQTGTSATASDLQLVEGSDPASADFSSAINITGYTEHNPYIGCNSHHAIAEDLKPGTAYCYRVGDKAAGIWSSVGTFTTDNGDNTFNFFYVTDSQCNTVNESRFFARTLAAIKGMSTNESFVIHGGDVVNRPAEPEQWYLTLDGESAPYVPNITFAPVAGNHDDAQYSTKNCLTGHFTVLPANSGIQDTSKGAYYSFDVGNTHIAILNSNDTSSGFINEQQVEWLKQDLKQSTATFKIVVMHHLMYSMGGTYYNGGNVIKLQSQLQLILEQNDVDLVFQAHEHLYQRTYQVSSYVPVTDPPLKDVTFGETQYSFYRNTLGPIFVNPGVSGSQTGFNTYYSLDPKTTTAITASDAEDQGSYFQICEPVKSEKNDKSYFTNISVQDNNLLYTAYSVNTDGLVEVVDTFGITKETEAQTKAEADEKLKQLEKTADKTGKNDADELAELFEALKQINRDYQTVLTAEQKDSINSIVSKFGNYATAILDKEFQNKSSLNQDKAKALLSCLNYIENYAKELLPDSAVNKNYRSYLESHAYKKAIVVGASRTSTTDYLKIDFSEKEGIADLYSTVTLGTKKGPAYASDHIEYLLSGAKTTLYPLESLRNFSATITSKENKGVLKLESGSESYIENYANYIPVINGSPVMLEPDTDYCVKITYKVGLQSMKGSVTLGCGTYGSGVAGIDWLGYQPNSSNRYYPTSYKHSALNKDMGRAIAESKTTSIKEEDAQWTTTSVLLKVGDNFNEPTYYANAKDTTSTVCSADIDPYFYIQYKANAFKGQNSVIYIDKIEIMLAQDADEMGNYTKAGFSVTYIIIIAAAVLVIAAGIILFFVLKKKAKNKRNAE